MLKTRKTFSHPKLLLTLQIFTLLVVVHKNLSKYSYAASSASAVGYVKASVMKSIKISKYSDLNFGNLLQGEALSTVEPKSKNSAAFTITGETDKSFSIVLPETITLKTGAGVSLEERIQVSHFESFPAKVGKITNQGTAELYVGATRDALSKKQESGEYSGVFTITLTYQ